LFDSSNLLSEADGSICSHTLQKNIDYAEHNRSFQSMGVWTADSASVTGRSVIGKTIRVDSRSWQIIGVMPRGFQVLKFE
jgi:hypothetical protein